MRISYKVEVIFNYGYNYPLDKLIIFFAISVFFCLVVIYRLEEEFGIASTTQLFLISL